MMNYHYINNYFCKAQNIIYSLDRLVVHYFYELINNNLYQVIAIIFSINQKFKTYYKVHRVIF